MACKPGTFTKQLIGAYPMTTETTVLETAEPAAPAPPSWFSLQILAGFNKLGKPMYGGTVDPAVKADRRVKNRAARKSRRVNRGSK